MTEGIPYQTANGILSAVSFTPIFVCPVPFLIRIDSIILCNTVFLSSTIHLAIQRSYETSPFSIAPYPLTLPGGAMYQCGPFVLSSNDFITGDATNNTTFVITATRYL